MQAPEYPINLSQLGEGRAPRRSTGFFLGRLVAFRLYAQAPGGGGRPGRNAPLGRGRRLIQESPKARQGVLTVECLGAVPAGLDEEHAVLTDAPTRERPQPQTDRLGQGRAVGIETQFDGGRHLFKY